ncbi:FUSC family protein [Arthrobacter sp. MYb213]|uniref:FUSC family protein n=1 Tax=Arthrobacter sp. MYb213 TaxID=1848595 RepID=UPI000CFCB1C2|nr:FUSC family protein [Arthrobacter sp. MYb213]PRB70435.1 hypothetical protein CQ011_09835 [Arthrobacter sp. MYb213]
MKQHLKAVWEHSITVGPARPSLVPATKAAFCVAVPLTLLAVTGRLDWAMYAAFGAFCSVFGRYDTDAVRFWQQLSSGLVQIAAMALGTFFSMIESPFVVRILVLAAIAFGANFVSCAVRWLPPGPVFAVFAGGACISVPATADNFVGVLMVGVGTVIFSVLFMLGLSLRRSNLLHTLGNGFSWNPNPRAYTESTQMALAVFIAGAVAYTFGGNHWYWASLGAIAAVIGLNTYARVSRAIQRCVGTCVGVLLTGVIVMFDPPIWLILLVAVASQFCIEMVILRHYAVGMIFMTVTALLMVHLGSAEPMSSLLVDRLSMTVLGAALGALQSIAIGLLVNRRAALNE